MPVGRFRPSTIASAVVTVAALVTSLPPPLAMAAAPPPQKAPAELADAGQATAAARKFGTRVGVANLTSATRQVFANPDGTQTFEGSVLPARAWKDGRWQAIDTALRADRDGMVSPGATTVPVRFSGSGATAALVELGDTQKFALHWPGPLPTPTLSGPDATYPEILPGVDLKMTATAAGYRQAFVVKTREAAVNPALAQLRLNARNTGLTMGIAKDGGLTATDPTGAIVFRSAKPQMWDAGDIEKGTQRRADVGLDVDGDKLTLVPDMALLADPATRFPVEIDPDMDPGRVGWTSPFLQFPTTTYWNGANLGSDARARVGYSGDWDGRPVTVQSFFKFDVAGLFGAEIVKAEFNILQNHTPKCEAREVGLHETGTIDPGTSWNTRPWIGQELGRRNVAYGRNPGCPADFIGFDVRSAVVNSVNGSRSDVTLMLKAVKEDDKFAWRKFDPNSATMVVTYNRAPDRPGELLIQGDKKCPLSPTMHSISTTTPTMHTVSLSDPDGGEVAANFEWFDAANKSLGSLTTQYQPSGTAFSARIPAGAYADGQRIRWQVRAYDRRVYGPWSTPCFAMVDTTRPDKPPAVTSEMYPERDLGGSIGATGTFHLDANGVADVTGFYYDLQDGASRYVAADKPGGKADVLVTPPDFGPQTLWVYSADKAGNRSVEPYRYEFFVGRGWATTGQWRLEGRAPETTTHDGSGKNHHGTLNNGVSWTTGRVGNAAHFNGVNSHISTGPGAAVDTTRSYSVSAWVKLDQANGFRTAVSQDGVHASGFFLQYAQDVNTWALSAPPQDNDDPDLNRVVATKPAVVGAWTHLLATQDAAAGDIKLYVDGVYQGSAEHTTRIATSGGLQIGRGKFESKVTDFFPGDIDEVKVFDRVLNAEEAGVLAGSPAVEEGRWLMDEGEGTIAFDSSDRARNLTLNTNAAWTVGYAGEGHALRFNGTDTTATTSQAALRTDGNYTVSAHLRIDAADATSRVAVGQDGTKISGFMIGYDGAAKAWRFAVPSTDTNGSALLSVTAPDPAVVGEWAHVTAVRDTAARQIRLYVNGVRVGMTPTTTATAWNAAGSLRLGGQAVGGRWLGDVDNVRVYTGIRTDDQIREESADPTFRAPNVFAGQFNRWVNHRFDQWLSRGGAPAGYMFSGTYGLPAPDDAPGTLPLYSCRIGQWDEFTSVHADCEGQEIIAKLGPVYQSPPADVPTLPLYRCIETANNNQHFDSHDPACAGQKIEGLLGYVRAYGNLIRSVQPEFPGDHWTDVWEMRAGNRPESNHGLLSLVHLPGTIDLFSCMDGDDQFVWQDSTCDGKTKRGGVGWIWTSPPAGVTESAALYNCRNKTTGERFTSTSSRCEGNGTGVQLGYVVTQL